MWNMVTYESQKRALMSITLGLLTYIFAALTTEITDRGSLARISK